MAGRKRVVVIGGGPAGLTAAYELLKIGGDRFEVDVLEADPIYVGGIARTAQYAGFRFDIGGHRFFSKSDEIEALWTELLGDDMIERSRMSRIYYQGRFFHYPLKPLNALVGLGPLKSTRVLASYARARAFPIKPERSFADWVTNRFGRRLYTIFFKAYTEKVWGMSCDELSADWAAQRIKGLSLTSAVFDALRSRRPGAGEVVKTLIDTFRYPRLGPGMLWERAAERIVELGGRVHLDRKVVGVERTDGAVTAVRTCSEDGAEQRFEADHVISSMPLRSLVRAVEPAAPAQVTQAGGALAYRDFLTVVLIVDRPDVFPDNWIYVHDPDVQVGRLQNYGNWSPEMVPEAGRSCIGLEYFCSVGDRLWETSDDDLVALGRRELAKLGVCGDAPISDGVVVRMTKAYPVYDDHYAAHVDTIRGWLEREAANLQVVGRNGMHRYNNQDHSMMTALLAARNLVGGSWDLWQVNSDAEYHESK
jgi:protoporphyrinogen oxidase